ncbi:thiol reductant ABC exporter subunit CydD [Paracoccus halophilus]|uniref:thiol reductant ABC exporter subunit CydD n=1 Tax=Paracoccus halophilus TaxID=376733 RepID=UPI000AEBF5DB|nr:thiol reductant ABC exporter subunit CydD [Paracoccus halophilus]
MPTLAALLWLPQAALLAAAIAAVAVDASLAEIARFAALAAVLGSLRALIVWVGERASFRQAREAVSTLRNAAVLALASRSPLDATRTASGEAASMIAEQAESITPWLARFGPTRLKAVVIPLAIFLTILPLSWAAALVLLIALPVIPVFMALIGWRAQAASKAQLVEVGAMNAFLLDRLRGLATIRGLAAVDRVAERVEQEAQSLRARTMAVLRIAFMTSAVLELFAALGVAMVAVYVGFHLLGALGFGAWGGMLGLGQGMFILLLAPAFFEPMRELSAIWHDKAAGQAAHENLLRLAQEGRRLPDAGQSGPPAAAPVSATGPAVVVRNLDIGRTDHESPLAGGLNFSVNRGEHVALVGPSGVGKTTILSLIAGLATAPRGRIEVFGQELRPDTAMHLRAGMAWIGQNPHIFAGSLAANITLGRSGIGEDAVTRALAALLLDDVARARGNAAIGEGGAGLSGGEALRLALARIAVAPQAALILADEPTAHLDPVTAGEITDSLLELAQGRTLIVATHDPRLAARMDRSIRLAPLEGRAAA